MIPNSRKRNASSLCVASPSKMAMLTNDIQQIGNPLSVQSKRRRLVQGFCGMSAATSPGVLSSVSSHIMSHANPLRPLPNTSHNMNSMKRSASEMQCCSNGSNSQMLTTSRKRQKYIASEIDNTAHTFKNTRTFHSLNNKSEFDALRQQLEAVTAERNNFAAICSNAEQKNSQLQNDRTILQKGIMLLKKQLSEKDLVIKQLTSTKDSQMEQMGKFVGDLQQQLANAFRINNALQAELAAAEANNSNDFFNYDDCFPRPPPSARG